MKSERLRVVTVTYNPGEELAVMAHSLGAATDLPIDLVIVDNGTETATVDAVAAAYGARVVRTGKNLGYGSAVNLGVHAEDLPDRPTGEWALVVNPDAVFLPSAVDLLLEETRWWPRGAAFGPLIRDVDGEVYPSARNFPRLGVGAGHALFVHVWASNPFTKAYHGDGGTEKSRAVDWLSGACLLLRREAFEDVGGFDESFFMFFEDTMLGEQFKEAGWRSIYVPAAQIVHAQGSSWREAPEAMLRAHHESAAHYLESVYDKPYQAPLRWALRGGLKARAGLQVRLAERSRKG